MPLMGFFFRGRRSLVSVPVLLLLGLGGFLGVKAWWYHGYSIGSRTGVIRKLAYKGPPWCKYNAGEMVVNGGLPGSAPEIWEFSVDNEKSDSPVLARLHLAEKGGERITLDYRQDLHKWWSCAAQATPPLEYFVTDVEK